MHSIFDILAGEITYMMRSRKLNNQLIVSAPDKFYMQIVVVASSYCTDAMERQESLHYSCQRSEVTSA